jgi:hypothetical protein
MRYLGEIDSVGYQQRGPGKVRSGINLKPSGYLLPPAFQDTIILGTLRGDQHATCP